MKHLGTKSSYKPRNALERFFDARLPLPRVIHDQFVAFPTPRNLNIWYSFGAVLAFFLGLQIVSGLVMAMHYVPDAALAFVSIETMVRQVHYGWLIRSMHATGATMIFAALYVHLFRGLYYGSHKAPREIVWILGILIYIMIVATAFLGYVLPWGQMSYWGATVITSLFGSLPGVGDAITHWLWGDFAMSGATLTRFYALHFVLPFLILGLVGLHIWALHAVGNNNPTGIDVKGPGDTLPFHPYFTIKDLLTICGALIVFAGIVFYAPDAFSNPDNYTPANPMVTPPEIQPEWYLLPYFAMLRAVPFKLLGIAVMLGAFVSPLFAPWLDTSKVRSCRYRPLMKLFFWGFAADCIVLGYVGSQGADALWHFGIVSIPLVWIGRLACLYYFGYFWAVMPLVGRIEKSLPLPDTIAKPVLSAETAAETTSEGTP